LLRHFYDDLFSYRKIIAFSNGNGYFINFTTNETDYSASLFYLTRTPDFANDD